MFAAHMQCGGSRNDYEENDQDRKDGSDPNIDASQPIVFQTHSLFDYRRLDKNLHIRRDGRSDDRHKSEKICRRNIEVRMNQFDRDCGPGRMREKSCDYITEEDERHCEKHSLDPLI